MIPQQLRDQLGITPGDEVEFALEGAAIRVELVRGAAYLHGTFKGRGLVSELEADHREKGVMEHSSEPSTD